MSLLVKMPTIAATLAAFSLLPSPAFARSIEEVIRLTVSRSPVVGQSLAERQIGDGRVDEARAAWRPHAEITAEGSRSFQRQYGIDPATRSHTNTSAYLTIRQSIFNPVTRHQVAAAQIGRQAIEVNVAGAEINAALTSVNNYFEVIQFRDQERFARGAAERVQRIIDFLQPRALRCQIEGRAPLPNRIQTCNTEVVNLEEARIYLQKFTADIRTAQTDLREAFLRLLVGMGEGRNPPEWTRNRNSASAIPAGYRIPERLPPIPNSPANALEIAERSNPLVRSARLHQQIAEQDGLAAAASQRPRAEAFASAGTITGQDYGGRVNELTVGGRVVVPLYDGGAARARQMQAGGQRNRAIQEERAAIQQTQNAINRVYVFLGYVDERAQNVGSRLTLQYHVFDRRWEELQAGGGNIYTSDILATVDEIYSLETEQVRLRIQKAYSHYDVLASIGTLLSSLPR